jgi:hypothetical protein
LCSPKCVGCVRWKTRFLDVFAVSRCRGVLGCCPTAGELLRSLFHVPRPTYFGLQKRLTPNSPKQRMRRAGAPESLAPPPEPPKLRSRATNSTDFPQFRSALGHAITSPTSYSHSLTPKLFNPPLHPALSCASTSHAGTTHFRGYTRTACCCACADSKGQVAENLT